MANEELKAVYDVTNVNGTPTLMKFPPENFYPRVRGSHDYLREHAMLDAADAEALFSAEIGRTPQAIDDIYIEYVPDTADDIRAGRLPRYKFWYATEENGQSIWHEVFKDGQRQGFGFTPAEMRKVLRQEKAEKDVTDALERARHRGAAEEMTRAQENLRRGQPNAPDRDAIIRGIEQRKLEEGYMQRGLPTPGNSLPGSYVESLQEQQEKIFKDEE
jgi:hypothetical protein